MADHIPDPGRHRTSAYGYYANRARGARAKVKAHLETAPAEAPKKRRCSSNWARLIAKVYQADPLTCRTCGGPLQIVAYIHDQLTIKTILDHLGRAPPEIERPPPQVRYVPVDDERRELEAMVAEGVSAPQWRRERVDGSQPGAVVCRRPLGAPPQGPGGRNRAQLRGVDPRRAPQKAQGGQPRSP